MYSPFQGNYNQYYKNMSRKGSNRQISIVRWFILKSIVTVVYTQKKTFKATKPGHFQFSRQSICNYIITVQINRNLQIKVNLVFRGLGHKNCSHLSLITQFKSCNPHKIEIDRECKNISQNSLHA